MRSIMTSYSCYFNLKYKHSGLVFESRYKAVLIDQDSYLQYMSRYIHLNPRFYERHRYSSLRYYNYGNELVWLHSNKILELFMRREAYMTFVVDYEALLDMLSELKYQLADQ